MLNFRFPRAECAMFIVKVSEALYLSQTRMPQYQSVLGYQIGTKPFAISINGQTHYGFVQNGLFRSCWFCVK
jgi:hypothetical protein